MSEVITLSLLVFLDHKIDCPLCVVQVEHVVLALIMRVFAILQQIIVGLILQVCNPWMSQFLHLHLSSNCFDSL